MNDAREPNGPIEDPSGREPVAVAVCTRDRPLMLARALASLTRLEPCGHDVSIIVVHNGPGAAPESGSSDPDAFPKSGPIHVAEFQVGIAHARNRALEEALQMGCRWLAFIDDDETAEPRWLAALLDRARSASFVLVGGPVRMQPPPDDATPEERIVWKGMSQRFGVSERRSARRARTGRDGTVTIVTNNWLCDLEFIKRHRLRFDPATAFSGGEDTQFYRDVVRYGGATGWAPDAIVYEEWPRSRLSLSYHRKRGHDQTATSFSRKLRERGLLVLPEAVLGVLLRGLAALFWLARSRFDGGVSRMRAARSLGAAAGIVTALRGGSSSHYEQVTGD